MKNIITLLMIVNFCFAQNESSIHVYIEDAQTQDPVQGATSNLNLNGSLINSQNSDESGDCLFANLNSGDYSIDINHEDYFSESGNISLADSEFVYSHHSLEPKIVDFSIMGEFVNGQDVATAPYPVNSDDLLNCEITVRNTGNVDLSLSLESWSTQIAMTPEPVNVSDVNISPTEEIAISFSFVISDGYINGNKKINYSILAQDPARTPDSTLCGVRPIRFI